MALAAPGAAADRRDVRPVTRFALLLPVVLSSVVVAGASTPGSDLPLARVLDRGPAGREAIALTFDDGWSPDATAALVAILEQRGVPATFFPQSDAVRRAPTLWKQIATAGFPIGNHSVSHPDLTQLRPDEQLAEIDGARREIEAITGVPMIAVLRPPYGTVNDDVRRSATAAGFPTLLLWSVAGVDWSETDPAAVARNALRGTDGAIVLLHAGPTVTVAALPAIIDGYLARGYHFVTVPELLGQGHP